MRLVATTDRDQRNAEPYRSTAALYWDAGWRAPLPLPAGRKFPPPNGYTGAAGVAPSRADVQAWIDGPEGAGNIALRLPDGILGIDVDAYGAKGGSHTFMTATGRWGALPPTWRVTSRDDALSGIYLFRVPEQLWWPGQLGPDVELIQAHHRYAVVWPSVHPEGRIYRWIRPDGLTSTVPPRPGELAELPDAWVTGLTQGRVFEEQPRNNLPAGQAGSWLAGRSSGQPCRAVAHTMATALADLAGPGSAHEATRTATMRLVGLAGHGHPGVTTALAALRRAFLADVTAAGRENRRDERTAEGEWASLVVGAVNKVTAAPDLPDPPPPDPCANPFAGLLPPAEQPVAAGTTALQPTQPATEEQAETVEAEHTSWWPKDLTRVLAGHEDDPTAIPAFLARSDGQRLFYPGRVNGLIGESESGKTWIALEAIRQALDDNLQVAFFDFEDTAVGVIARLRALQISDDQLDRFAYISPDEALHAAAAADLTETLTSRRPQLIVLDGFNAAMTLLGLELESNTDATKFAQQLLKPLAATGAAVVTVDHLPKNKEQRGKGGIGAQAKRAMASGCLITVEVLTPPAPGTTGKLHLTVDKDRPGAVRGASAGARNVGTAVVASDPGTGDLTITIEAPERGSGGPFRPTTLMERVSTFLATVPAGASGKAIEDGVRGNHDSVRIAVQRLVEEGHVDRSTGPRGAVIHRLVEPFLAEQEAAEELAEHVRPTQRDGVVFRAETGEVYTPRDQR